MEGNDGKIITIKFKINDIVKITNRGRIYPDYDNAFKFFNILDKTEHNGMWYFIDDTYYDFDANWFICGFALHEESNEILYHIVNEHKQHLIIDERGLQYNGIKKPRYLLIKKEKCFVKRIPKN